MAVRSGPTVMLISGLMGGIFLGAMEGAAVLFGKVMGGGSIDPQPIILPDTVKTSDPSPPPPPPQQQQSSSESSSFSGLFGKAKFGFGGHP